MEAETPAEVRDVLPAYLVRQGIHEFVSIHPPSEQRAVSAEITPAECGRNDYCLMRFGERSPSLDGLLCVPGKIVIRFRAIRPREAVR
jgi:hypothetical protein